jgi:hypothetical protein
VSERGDATMMALMGRSKGRLRVRGAGRNIQIIKDQCFEAEFRVLGVGPSQQELVPCNSPAKVPITS